MIFFSKKSSTEELGKQIFDTLLFISQNHFKNDIEEKFKKDANVLSLLAFVIFCAGLVGNIKNQKKYDDVLKEIYKNFSNLLIEAGIAEKLSKEITKEKIEDVNLQIKRYEILYKKYCDDRDQKKGQDLLSGAELGKEFLNNVFDKDDISLEENHKESFEGFIEAMASLTSIVPLVRDILKKDGGIR